MRSKCTAGSNARSFISTFLLSLAYRPLVQFIHTHCMYILTYACDIVCVECAIHREQEIFGYARDVQRNHCCSARQILYIWSYQIAKTDQRQLFTISTINTEMLQSVATQLETVLRGLQVTPAVAVKIISGEVLQTSRIIDEVSKCRSQALTMVLSCLRSLAL